MITKVFSIQRKIHNKNEMQQAFENAGFNAVLCVLGDEHNIQILNIQTAQIPPGPNV